MIKGFDEFEKMALVAIMKFMINADGRITEGEIESIRRISHEKGFDDFHEVFQRVDETVHSLGDLEDLLFRVRNDTHKKDIVKYSIQIALDNGSVDSGEHKILAMLKEMWAIDPEKIMEG